MLEVSLPRPAEGFAEPPLALVTTSDDRALSRACKGLDAAGFLSLASTSITSARATIDRLRVELLVLDVRRGSSLAVDLLLHLARATDAPSVLLIADGDTAWIAARFGVHAVGAVDAETLDEAFTEARRGARRPELPT